jgi:hypothetical protein
MLALGRGREFCELRAMAHRTIQQITAAIGAAFFQPVGAIGAKCALERADKGAMFISRQIAATPFAIGSHFQHISSLPFLSLHKYYQQ